MKKKDRMVGNAYYEYVNVNPKNKICGDCVIRAIANACRMPWEQVVRELTEMGIKEGLVLNDKKLYPKYLQQKGFILFNEPRDYYNKKMDVRHWMTTIDDENSVFVANVGSHHVTCIRNGKVEDIWDCSKETMHKYWYKLEM